MANWDFAMAVKAIRFFSKISAAELILARNFQPEQRLTVMSTERRMTEATPFIIKQTLIQTGMMRLIIRQTTKSTALVANH